MSVIWTDIQSASIYIIIMKKLICGKRSRVYVCVCMYWVVAGVNAMDYFLHAAAFIVMQLEFVVRLL